MMNKIYAGIGSRKTPAECCHTMARLAGRLSEAGWTLRSGAALALAQGVEMAACALDDVNQFNYANMLDDLAQKIYQEAAQ